MTDISQIQLPNNAKYNINVPFVEGTGTTAGTWLGTLDGLTEYYDGLMILYKINIKGASTTTLNLNSLGAKTCYIYGTIKLATNYPVGSIILLVYSANQNGGCWVCASNYYYTYFNMTASELIAGTATTGRTVRADYLKQGIEEIIGENSVELTQAEYDALPDSKLTDGINYFITDAQAGVPLATEIAMSSSDSTSVADKIDELETLQYAEASITSSYVTGGNIWCYKHGGALVIKANGIKFSSFSGRITVGTAPVGFRPSFESTGMFDASTTVFGIRPNGEIWVDTGVSGRQVWGMLTTVLA